ncbi:MAG: hypothetical protein PHW72_02250 [Candidatus Pacebacteria bacterium]|nr:hypothetical protein [Candidatus Paceibacterota bacterium]
MVIEVIDKPGCKSLTRQERTQTWGLLYARARRPKDYPEIALQKAPYFGDREKYLSDMAARFGVV